MSGSPKVRLLLFLIFSVAVLGALVWRLKNDETAVVVTLCGGKAQYFDYFSSDFRYSQKSRYPGGSSFSSIRFKPDERKAQLGHRFDFGGIPGEKFLVSSIVLKTPGFCRYVLDLKKADQWIKRSNQLKKPVLLDHKLLIETTGSDGYLVTKDNLFEHYAQKKLDLSGKEIAYAACIEVFLFVFLLLFPWLVKGVISFGKKLLTRAFLIQSGVFAAVNLVVIFPAVYFFCRNSPDVFSITLKAENSFTLEIFYKKPYSARFSRQSFYTAVDKFRTLNIPLPKDAEKTRIRLDFGWLSQAISVKSISVIHHGLFSRSVDLEHASEIYTSRNHIDRFSYQEGLLNMSTCGTDPYIVPDPVKYSAFESFGIRFGALFWTIAGAEILLLLVLSRTVRRLILKISPVRPANKENLLLALSVAGAFAFIMTFSLPLQTFKAAEEVIMFKINILLDLLYYLIPAVFFGAAAILFLLNKRYGAVFSFLLAAVTFMFAVECGPLSFGLPELNGDFDAYHNVPRMVVHAVIWCVFCIFPLLIQKQLRRWLPLIMLVACILNGAALADSLMKPAVNTRKTPLIVPSDRLMPIDETLEYVRLSEKDNVIMICLDGVSAEVVHAVFEKYPALKKRFTGFISFTNNIGMGPVTMYTVPGFFTGEYVSHETLYTYPRTIYSPDSIVKHFMDKNYALFLRVGLSMFSYVDPDGKLKAKKYDLSAPFDDSLLPWLYGEFFLFKISPFFCKGPLMKYLFYKVWPERKIRKNNRKATLSFLRKDDVIYDSLAKAPIVSSKYAGTFQYHHFHGGHQPFNFDENGKAVNRSHIPWQKDWEGYLSRVTLEIRRVAGYFDTLKKRGLYDRSTIIVLADHGIETAKKQPGKRNRMKPFLMVKPLNAFQPFREDSSPVSTGKVAGFLKSDLSSISPEKVIRHFTTHDRHFIWPVQDGNLMKFTLSDDGSVYSKQILRKKKRKLNPILLSCSYLLNPESVGNILPDLDCKMFKLATQGFYIDHNDEAQLKFVVKDGTKSYSVRISSYIKRDFTELIGEEHAFDIYTQDRKCRTVFDGKGIIRLDHVRSNRNGEIAICFKRRKKPVQENDCLFILGFQVVPE